MGFQATSAPSIPLPPSSFPPSPTFFPLSLHFCCSLSLLPRILHSTIPKMPLCVCVSPSSSLGSLSLSSFSPSFLSLLSLSFIPLFLSSFRLFFSPPSLSPSNLSLSLSHLSPLHLFRYLSLSLSLFSWSLSLSLYPTWNFIFPNSQGTASSSVSSFSHSVSMHAHP